MTSVFLYTHTLHSKYEVLISFCAMRDKAENDC